MSLIRVLQTAQVTLTHTFYVDETPTDAVGSVTVTTRRLDGTLVGSPATATSLGSGVYTFVKPGYVDLDTHLVEWSGTVAGAALKVHDVVEIVGGFYFGLAEVRAMKPPLDPAIYSTAELAAKRTEVEQEVDRITHTSFVPRFARVVLSGNGTDRLRTPDMDLRTIRAIKTAWLIGGTFHVWDSTEISYVGAHIGGVLIRDIGLIWPRGTNNVIIEYEYGQEYPPEDLRSATKKRLRSLLSSSTSSIPDRTLSYSTPDGASYRLTTPSKEMTGIPDVDAAYERACVDAGGFA
jgi:hypothetical protein